MQRALPLPGNPLRPSRSARAVAGTRKTVRKGTSRKAGSTSAARAKSRPSLAKSSAGRKKPAAAGAKRTKREPALAKQDLSPPDTTFELWSVSTLAQQRQAGYALLILSLASILGIGVWVATDSLHSIGQWAFRATIRGICLAMLALSLWTILSRRRTVSGVLVISAGALGLLVFETGTAWWADRARDLANRTLLELEAGRRDVESLTPLETADPYIEAYVVMRDIYWELSLRSDDEMSRYRAYYEDYTSGGAFLDVTRLTTAGDIHRSILQIEDLQRRLQRVEASRPDISDLLLTVSLLDVDDDTRAAYAADLRAARDTFLETTRETVAQERETLRTMRSALEALLEAAGRYRIEDGQLIFEHPEDAARFVGKEGPG